MKTHHCCQLARPASLWRRGRAIAGWIIPGAVLVLLPKCPACVVMYVALFSGVGISVAGAATLRTTLLVLSVAALLGLALKGVCRWGSRLQKPGQGVDCGK